MKPQYIEIDKDGNKFYYSDKAMTKCHRVDGPAVEYKGGLCIWYLNGKKHRVDGPAVKYKGGLCIWYLNGKKHREDGPAVTWNGSKLWYLSGLNITQEEHARRTKKVPTVNINGKDFTLEELNSLIKTAEGNKV